MSDSEGREVDPYTGYPHVEDSPTSEDAGNDGATSGSGEAAPQGQEQSRNEPPPGSPRWNEIYRNWKDQEREAQQLRDRLAAYEADGLSAFGRQPETPPQVPSQPPPQAPAGQSDDPMELFYAGMEARLLPKIEGLVKPIQETFEQQRQAMTTQQHVDRFKATHPDYESSRDDPILIQTARQAGISDPSKLGMVYRLAFPERVVAAQQRQQQDQATRAPIMDAPSTGTQAPRGSPEELMREFQSTKDPYRREEIASQLANMGAWGAGRAEKALGLG